VQACKAHIVWRASFCSFHLQGAYHNTPKAFFFHVLHFVDCEVALLCKLLLHCCKNLLLGSSFFFAASEALNEIFFSPCPKTAISGFFAV
jgi:hypothetical protein